MAPQTNERHFVSILFAERKPYALASPALGPMAHRWHKERQQKVVRAGILAGEGVDLVLVVVCFHVISGKRALEK